MTNLTIIIGKTVEEKYYFRVRNNSGKILLTSREYGHFDKCINEIYGIQIYRNVEFDREKVSNGYQYSLLGPWGRMVGHSPVYRFESEMYSDMNELKFCLQDAEVEDYSSTVRFFRPVRI